ncbi:MAG: O-succinylbenzoate--CoA ligase [Peptococcaceae bacterium BRH_c4b]|nr:MAG: O-succinylbenzoate--CoA ligase [Peptococcaceae bacterium BRH_c4b]
MNLPLRLDEIGRVSPGKEALVYYDQRLTYAQLNAMVNQLANGLLKLGIKPGDRVLIALSNCPEFIVSYFAIMRIRAVVVPINNLYTQNEVGLIMRDSLPVAVITDANLVPVVTKLAAEIDIRLSIIVTRSSPSGENIFSYKKILEKGAVTFKSVTKYQRDEVVELLYTSGSTGSTKGAMLTNNNLYSNAITFAQLNNLTPADKSLLVAPAFHAAAQTCVMNASVVSGATLVVHDGWVDPATLLKAIQDEKITFYFGPPTMYALLVNHPDTGKYNTGSWRTAYTGASALSADIFNNFEKKFGFQITEGYGLTETSPMVTSNPVEGTKKPGSIGLPIPDVEIKIVDYEDIEMPPGEIGEIIVRGPNVMKGYFNREEETRWIMRNGWFHTGDLAYKDSDGYLFIVDRIKDLIIRGGLNIYPREVEEVLYTHPKVFEVAVVGVPDAVMGEEVLAFILLRNGDAVDPEELKEFCRDKLARYKIPRYIRFVENLPKTTSGKLLKSALRKMIEEPRK